MIEVFEALFKRVSQNKEVSPFYSPKSEIVIARKKNRRGHEHNFWQKRFGLLLLMLENF